MSDSFLDLEPISCSISSVQSLNHVRWLCIVDETETDRCFSKFPCFLYNPANAGNLISSSSSFSKLNLDICKFLVPIMLKPRMQDFKHGRWVQLPGGWHILWYYPSWELGWRLTFSSPVATAGSCRFANMLNARPLVASSSRDLNSFVGILPHPVALLTAVLLQAHLTSHSSMFGFGWLTTPL